MGRAARRKIRGVAVGALKPARRVVKVQAEPVKASMNTIIRKSRGWRIRNPRNVSPADRSPLKAGLEKFCRLGYVRAKTSLFLLAQFDFIMAAALFQ